MAIFVLFYQQSVHIKNTQYCGLVISITRLPSSIYCKKIPYRPTGCKIVRKKEETKGALSSCIDPEIIIIFIWLFVYESADASCRRGGRFKEIELSRLT
jgi:hypothetical protein